MLGRRVGAAAVMDTTRSHLTAKAKVMFGIQDNTRELKPKFDKKFTLANEGEKACH